MFTVVRRLSELIRFSHTLFALPFAMLSAALAWKREGVFRILDLIGIVLCMVFARSAAMAFNRLADRRIDALNPRTASRHLPAGTLSVAMVAIFTVICSVGFVGATTMFLLREEPNYWPLYLSGPVLAFICLYSLTKRFTALAHFWLGASLMLAPVSAWIAIRGLQDMVAPLLIGCAVLCWVSGFDILYACQDADFDRRAKLHSVPARIGIHMSLRLALACHVLMIGVLTALYLTTPEMGLVFLIGMIAVGLLLAYEHWLVRPDDLTRVNRAFFQVNVVISVGLLVLVLVQLAVL
ncbi:MAG TPA: UbiA-like polyprenyltransferase [Gemmataceae bacterium]|nr:UbiA-like polyprenyltransferase [Gemmataceae bacterium]